MGDVNKAMLTSSSLSILGDHNSHFQTGLSIFFKEKTNSKIKLKLTLLTVCFCLFLQLVVEVLAQLFHLRITTTPRATLNIRRPMEATIMEIQEAYLQNKQATTKKVFFYLKKKSMECSICIGSVQLS
jgi:hypothetical protein